MPEFLKAIILGLVEGATEFIPVSSTGHLIIASEWLHFTGDRAKTFEIFIQLGAILAIVWLYRTTFVAILTSWSERGPRRLLINLAISFLPAAITGVLIYDWIKLYLFNSLTVAIALVVGGILMLVIETLKPPTRIEQIDEIPHRTALGVGLAQVLSLFPGISRSGATIMGGYCLGLSRRAATEFSFFLAVPIMVAATLYDLFGNLDVLTRADAPVFAVGFIVSFISALVVVKAFLGYVSRKSFAVFAWYRIAFGSLLLAWFWLGK